jgi:hypothetical protein
VSLWFIAACLVVTSALMVGGLWLVRRRSKPLVGDAKFTIIFGPFGVLLAFVILVSYQDYNNTASQAQAEANAITNLAELAAEHPSPTGRRVWAYLTCYSRAVVDLEWPAMAHGGDSTVVNAWTLAETRAGADLVAGSPTGPSTLDQYAPQNFDRGNARQSRLAQARSDIPTPLAVVLVLGAIVVLIDVLCLADPRDRFLRQAIMAVGMTVIVVSGLLLVRFFNSPFENEPGSLQPTAMERTVAFLESAATQQHPPPPRLCNAQGQPLS